MSAAATKGQAFELIPLSIEAKGEVIASNVAEFRELVKVALGAINREPKTDEEFGQAEQDVKALKGAEDSVKSAKEQALKDAEELHVLFTTLDETSEEIRQARLELEKTVKAKKEEVRLQIIAGGVQDIDLEIPLMKRQRMFEGELVQAIKGKRTLASMQDAVDVTVKIINGRIAKARAILDEFEAEHGRDLILDRDDLEAKTPDQVEAELRRRLDVKKANDEKIAAQQEAAKAKAEAEAAKEAAQAKTTLVDAGEPPNEPAPVTGNDLLPADKTISVSPSVGAEWAGFEAKVILTFKELKAAKEKLRYSDNQARADRFGAAVNAAWTACKKEVAE